MLRHEKEESDEMTERLLFCNVCQKPQRHNTKAFWLHCIVCRKCYTCERPRTEKCRTCVVFEAKVKADRRNGKLKKLLPEDEVLIRMCKKRISTWS